MKKLNFLFLLLMCLFVYQSYEGQNFTVTTCSTGIGSNTYGPMNSTTTTNNKNRTAFILPASQLAAINGGTITGTYFRRIATSGSLPAGTNFKIYLKLTTATDFGSASPDWATEISTATLVYDSDPAAAVGSAAGFKQFAHTTNFSYTSGSNLAVYLEYTQTTAPSSSITWDYEYGTTCISTTNNNTTKYLNTSSAFTATLASSNYRRPVIGFDVTFPPAVAAPACTTISAPAANATGVSVTPTFTWAGVLGQNGATSYLINLGTSSGGTDVMNGVDVGNVTTYTVSSGTPLNFNQQYYLTVIPKNSIGSATGCTERSFTTANISCPSVSAPAAAATGVSTTPTITWAATTGATGYKISMGTTSGGTDVLNNVDVGNVTTYTLSTALNTSTTYYYTVNAYNGGTISSSCTIRNFTTVCGAYTPSYTNNFSTFPGACWSRLNGGSPATGPGTGTTNYWIEDGFLNSGSTGAARINLYSTARNGWLISPAFNLSAGGYRVKFDYGLTAYGVTTSSPMGSDDVLQFVVSTDGGTTWTVLQTWNASNAPGNTLNTYTLNLTAYNGNNVIFAVYGSDGTVDDAPDYDFFVDNFVVESIPTCDVPTGLNTSAITSSGATLAWTSPATAPANGYEIYYSTSNTAPTGATVPTITGVMTTSQNLGSLSAATTYYVWVRSKCSASDLSQWSSSAVFTTLCSSFSAPFTENFNSGAAPNCWSTSSTNNTGYALWQFGSSTQDYGTTYSAAGQNNTAGQFAYVDASSPYTGVHDVTLMTPMVNLTGLTNPALEFRWFKNHGTGVNPTSQPAYDNNKLTVDIKDVNSSTWETIFADTSNASTWRTVSLVLPAAYIGKTVQVRFVVDKDVAGNGYFYDNLLLDDISLKESTILATNELKDTKNYIKVYPNPFADVLNISNIANVKNVLVTDIAGRLVKTIANPISELHLGELKQGMYLVTLEMKDGSRQTIKAIKK